MRAKLVLLASILLPLFIAVAYAGNSISSGYAVTTDYHGKDVLPGTLVTATAYTTDSAVQNITFKWNFPDGTTAFTDPEVPVFSNGTKYNGMLIYYAQSSYMPTVLGDWGVQALFNGPGGHLQGQGSDIIAIKATSFNMIPEVPVLGTAGAGITMFLGLGFYRKKKQK